MLNELARTVLSQNHLPDPYNSVDLSGLSYDGHGWFGDANRLNLLFQMTNMQPRPKVVIELGSWLGKSTRWFADQVGPDGLVIAIDHWLGSPEHHQPNRRDVRDKLPRLYEQFLYNCRDYPNILPLRGTTHAMCSLWMPAADVLYIDAAHEYQAVLDDICNYARMVGHDGLISGDDYIWEPGEYGVEMAVKEFCKQTGCYDVHVDEAFWWLTRR